VVRPKLVAQIGVVEWTVEGRLRHAAFLGSRKWRYCGDEKEEEFRAFRLGHALQVSRR
jgi:ATP-dependent DNA ligase